MATNNGRVEAPRAHDGRAATAARVRAARAFAGLDQQAVADHFGVHKVTVKRMERGEREMSMADLASMARLCGVPVGFMVNGFIDDDPEAESIALAAGQLLRDEVASAFRRFDAVSEALLTDAEAIDAARGALQRLLTRPD